METLKRHIPVSGPEDLRKINRIAVKFEGNFYASATSQSYYLREISSKMLKMWIESQSTLPKAPSNSAGNSSENLAGKRARLPPSNQDERQNSVDYISQLPDAIILHIFSFMTTEDAIKTSVLSKRWCSTWTSNQYMSFSLPPRSRRKCKSFITFVDSVLLRCTAIKAKRFLFDAPCYALIQSSLDRWLQFAIEHGIKEVSVSLHYWRHKVYVLPRILFCCTTLVSLRVSQCCFSVFGTVNWCSLKTLCIDYVKLNDDGMMRVLSGSPVLEFLELKSCEGVKHIMVESKSFRELAIDSHKFCGQVSMLKISAPHLLKLRLLGNSRGGEFRLDEVSSLIEAELNFNMEIFALDKVKAHADLVKGLLKRLHHVTILVMGSWCLQALSLMEARDMFLPSLKCRHLILLGAAGREGVPEAIAKILESTRLLEKLSLQTTCSPDSAFQMCISSLPPGGSQKSKGFIAFVDSVLSRYTAKKVKRFLFDAPSPVSMRFSLDRWLPLAVECGVEEVSASLDRWLQFAVEHDVEEVSVTLNNRRHKIYALPQILFSCNTLVSLCISRCRFRVFGTVNWCSLKKLHIELAELNDDGMMRVLSGSPVLELLELKRCVGIKHIIIESKSFRELVIDSHEFYGQASMLKISAPHLLKLCLLGKSRGGEFRLDEVSSLIEAELNFEMLDEVKARADLLKGLLERLHNVTKLVMGSWCLQALSLMEARDMFLPSLKCRHLILLAAAGHEGVPEAIAKILESTRLLEKLSLQMTCTPDSEIGLNAEWAGSRVFAGEEFWNFVKWRIYQCLMHLRHVEIVDGGASLLAWEPVLSLLKFLLQNALWLDRIVINSTNSKSSQAFEPSPLLEVARILLSHPKCSPSAKVILRYPFQGCPSV